jgi:hypothetical protein
VKRWERIAVVAGEREMKCKELIEVKPSFVELAGCEGFESMIIDSFLSLSSASSSPAFGHSNCSVKNLSFKADFSWIKRNYISLVIYSDDLVLESFRCPIVGHMYDGIVQWFVMVKM